MVVVRVCDHEEVDVGLLLLEEELDLGGDSSRPIGVASMSTIDKDAESAKLKERCVGVLLVPDAEEVNGEVPGHSYALTSRDWMGGESARPYTELGANAFHRSG